MPHSKTHLLAVQFDVLSWIAEGCPEGVMTGVSHRITARALSNRGFVVIRGHGSTWTATITEAGSKVLNDAAQPHKESRTAESEAEIILRAVIDAGGSFPEPGKRDRASVDRLLAAALKVGWRPVGKKLEFLSSWNEEARWHLTEHYPDMVEPAPVPVSARLRHPHAAVLAYGQNKDWQQVSKPHVHRASIILNALAAEAERRGYVARPRRTSHQPYERGNAEANADVHLVIEINRNKYLLTVKEISEPGGEALDYRARDRMPGWMARRQTAFISTGRLQLSLETRFNGRKHEFRDSRRSTLEKLLPEVLREIEIRNLEDDARQRERDDADDRARTRWENAIRKAEQDLQFEHKANQLRRQASSWQEADAIRGYIQAMTDAVTLMPPEERATSMEWIDWARQYVDGLDPLKKRLAIPADKSFTQDDLRPFLGGLNPYHP